MVSSEEEAEAKPAEDTLEWDVDMEIQLFYAMANHKPVGINKHFQMACIWDKLTNSISKEVSTHDIWKHLETLYDISMLDDTEPIPFPNKEVPFSLPESEYGELLKQKCSDTAVVEEVEDCGSPWPKISTPRSTSSKGTTSKDSTPKATPQPAAAGRCETVVSSKSRKESGSSHASTDTPSIKSDKDYDRRRDSRDSNASAKDGSGRKSMSQRDKAKAKVGAVASTTWESPLPDEEGARRGRRRAATSTPPTVTPAKRRRT